MTKDELIQKVMIFEPSTMVAYMMALRSDNPTIESVMQSLIGEINPLHQWERTIWKGFSKETAWQLLNYIHICDIPRVQAALDQLKMISMLCYGEQIAAVAEELVIYIKTGCHNLHFEYFQTEKDVTGRIQQQFIHRWRDYCWSKVCPS